MAAVAAAGWFFIVVLDTDSSSAHALLALSVLLWLGVLLGMGFLLPVLPDAVLPEDRWLRRLKKRVAQAAYVAGFVAAMGLAIFAVGMTLRALRLGFG